VAVLGAADLALPPLPEQVQPPSAARAHLARPCLALDRVRFVGEAVAVVVARSQAEATDAAELVELELEDLGPLVDPLAALEPGAPLLFPEHGSNVVGDVPPDGDEEQVLAGSDVVVAARFVNQRVAPAPMEPNGILAVPGPEGQLTLWVSTQSPFGVRGVVSALLGLEPAQLRVVAPAVGGGFGAKGGAYPEHVVVAAVARRLERPVRWQETRSENLVAMTHGRGQVAEVELGARSDGTLVGLRARTVTEAGAYAWRGTLAARTARLMGAGPYRLPQVALRSMTVVTTTTPTGPYRGAGRPEAAALLERAMDLLAARLGMDPAEVRRRNLLRPDELPYRTPTGAFYDSGDYQGALDKALAQAGYERLRAEQAERRRVGDPMALGIGMSCFVEVSGSGTEWGGVRVEDDGTVTVLSGSSPHGQGHETTLAQVAASVLGVPFDRIRVVHSDTSVIRRGVGTFGSRSGQLAGNAVFGAGKEVLERARELAAHLLEAAREDIVQDEEGNFLVAGVPSRSVSWAALAAAARDPAARPEGTTAEWKEEGLAAEADFVQTDGTYPFGSHVAVVEVDTETGQVHLRRLVAVDDCGTVVNPTIVAGQVHGGLAQGVAQALFEAVAYDERGNPLAANLADYAFPSAADLPSWELGESVTPSPRNPLGMKGVGESGTVGATPAVQNAVLDALAPFGIEHLDLPLTPQRVWAALEATRR
jgi:carbon-monoxide dehydrogenase large subunit